MSSVFCYVRPWNYEQFKTIAENLFYEDDFDIKYLSEHHSLDTMDLSSEYYSKLDACRDNLNDFFSEDEITEIIKRCRLLRELSFFDARKHVLAMTIALTNSFIKHKPKAFLSVTVDSYILDICSRLCDKFSVAKLFIVPSFVNGYFRLTTLGEANFVCDPNKEIVYKIKSTVLVDNYVPYFNRKSVQSPKFNLIKRFFSNIARYVYFSTLRKIKSDKYNYHYWSSEIVSRKNLSFEMPLSLGTRDWESKIGLDDRKNIFIPLQMYPECTIDYWSTNNDALNYNDFLFQIIKNLSSDFNVFVKEHPSVSGQRPNGFYKKLYSMKSVFIIPTTVHSNYILSKMDAAAVLTGTIGLESNLRGIPTICFSNSYYQTGSSFYNIATSFSNDDIISYINDYPVMKNENENEEIMIKLSQQLLEGSFRNDGSWDLNNIAHVNESKLMAKSLRSYYIEKNKNK
ncbi:hypothetical protein [Vibrio sp. NH-UV-68]|uniref:capsular polysaccharide export protein, LipB/KpsS family n=1 Tax=unclassified Vibrio TaxID=2614977 RepID=UPI0036F336C4